MAKRLSKNKVVVGISGGVDSAICLDLLLKQGLDAKAVYIEMARYHGNVSDDIKSARKVADLFGVDFEVLDARELFLGKVVSYFNKELKAGRTPSPCVLCNPEVKIAVLLKHADSIGAYYVATGHYARIKQTDDFFLLRKAKDRLKDQTYSLCFLSQKHLSRMLLPLGEFTKAEVYRKLGEIKGAKHLVDRKQSQDFCYLGGIGQSRYCIENFPYAKGNIVDKTGRILGYHNGMHQFTIGQRKGIKLSQGPYYVIAKDIKNNKVIVSKNERDLLKKEVKLFPYNIVDGVAPKRMVVSAKLRSSQKLKRAILKKNGKYLILSFYNAQRAITPGQIAVFYKDEICLGGGVINI